MIEIIPAIDLIGGRCVRLTRGDYNQRTEYRADPVDMALRFEDHGFKRLHLVDLDGAREGRPVNFRVLEKIAARTRLVIDAGGGLKTDEDLKIVFGSGATMVTGGSVAVKDPERMEAWLTEYGPEKIILGSDFRDGKIAVSGWTENTGEELIPFLSDWMEKGIQKTICTDVSRDGVLKGPSIKIYQEILKDLPALYLVASGGVSSMEDIIELAEKNIPAVIVGKAIYERKIELRDMEVFLRSMD